MIQAGTRRALVTGMIDLGNRSLGWMAFDVGLALALGVLLAVF